jgi:hypothetical protein
MDKKQPASTKPVVSPQPGAKDTNFNPLLHNGITNKDVRPLHFNSADLPDPPVPL